MEAMNKQSTRQLTRQERRREEQRRREEERRRTVRMRRITTASIIAVSVLVAAALVYFVIAQGQPLRMLRIPPSIASPVIMENMATFTFMPMCPSTLTGNAHPFLPQMSVLRPMARASIGSTRTPVMG